MAILAHNRRRALRKTLTEVLRRLDYPADRLEVVVVDNASTDQTADMVERDFPNVQLIVQPSNIGVSGWNAAFATGKGDYFLVLDDDCYLSGHALKRATSAAQESAADLVSFRVASSEDDDYYFTDEYNTGLLSFWGCSALLSRRAIDQLGGFDRNIFIWAHELEYTMRLLDQGLRHLFVPEIVAVHMKEPLKASFSLFPYKTNNRHLCYVAGKLLERRAAVRAFVNLVSHVIVQAVIIRPIVLTALPGMVDGFTRGMRSRAPVRPEVSQAYVDNFVDFQSPLRFFRGVRPTLRAWGDPVATQAERRATWHQFFAERPRFYPRGKASLQL